MSTVAIRLAASGELLHEVEAPEGASVLELREQVAALECLPLARVQLLAPGSTEVLDDGAAAGCELLLVRLAPSFGKRESLGPTLDMGCDEEHEVVDLAGRQELLAAGLLPEHPPLRHGGDKGGEGLLRWLLQVQVAPDVGPEGVEMRWTETISGLGARELFRAFVPPGEPLSLNLERRVGGMEVELARFGGFEHVWAPVVWPTGPRIESGYAAGCGLPPPAFVKLSQLRPLPRVAWAFCQAPRQRRQRLLS